MSKIASAWMTSSRWIAGWSWAFCSNRLFIRAMRTQSCSSIRPLSLWIAIQVDSQVEIKIGTRVELERCRSVHPCAGYRVSSTVPMVGGVVPTSVLPRVDLLHLPLDDLVEVGIEYRTGIRDCPGGNCTRKPGAVPV